MNTKVKLRRLLLLRQWSTTLAVLLLSCVHSGTSQVLTPPYFNLAENRPINATATCGENGREEYCKLVGASADTDINIDIRYGQVCYLFQPLESLVSTTCNSPFTAHPLGLLNILPTMSAAYGFLLTL